MLEKAEAERKRYPCDVNRASSIGYFVPELEGCVRRGVYERTSWEQKELWDAQSILRFREGDRQERAVLRDLMDTGAEVIEQQATYDWKEYQIRGHVDGKLIINGQALPLEIKSCSPNIFPLISDWDSLLKKPWLRAYQAQVTCYQLMQDVDQAVMLFRDKSSGLTKQVNVGLDYELGEACIRTAEEINRHVDAGTMPDRITDRQTCARCPFRHLCLPDIEFGEPLQIRDDPEFEERLDRAMGSKDAADTYKKEWDIVRAEAKASAGPGGELKLIVGKWSLVGKTSKTGRFSLKVEEL